MIPWRPSCDQSTVLNFSRRQTVLTPEVYLRASAREVQAYYLSESQASRGQAAPAEPVPRRQALGLALGDVLQGGYVDRYRNHLKRVEGLQATAAT